MAAPEPSAPPEAAPVPAAPLAPDAQTMVASTDDGAGNTSEVVAVTSNRSWTGALFASGDMSVDSMIVCMIVSVIAFWGLCGYQIVTGHETVTPMAMGGGFALMLAAFAGGKTARDRFSPQAPQPGGANA